MRKNTLINSTCGMYVRGTAASQQQHGFVLQGRLVGSVRRRLELP